MRTQEEATEATGEDYSPISWALWATPRRLIVLVMQWLAAFALLSLFISNPFRSEPSAGATPSGSLREDLLATLRAAAAFLGTPLGENLVLMALRQDLVSDRDNERFLIDRVTRAALILERAETRGELRPGINHFLALETQIGPMYLRFLLTREPLNESAFESVVDLLLTGIAAQRPRGGI